MSTTRSAELERQLPDVASGIARFVHSGATLLVAIEDMASSVDGPAGSDLALIVDRVRHGWLLDDALLEWQRMARSASVDLLVAACRLGHAEGGDLRSALEGVAAALLDRMEVADESRALTSQARMSAYVLGALPLLGAIGFSVLDPRVARMLLSTQVGLLCLVAGIGLNVLGAWCLAMIVRAALR